MKVFIFLIPILLSLIFLCIKLIFPGSYEALIQEDSVIEYMQFLFYFLSSIVSFLASVKFLRNKMLIHGVLYGMLAFMLLFISFEEISWGQRIFDIANPDYFQRHNVQNEISVHNLDSIQPLLHRMYILIGAYGAFAWIFINWLKLKAKLNSCHILFFLAPDWFISSYFFFTFFIYTVINCIPPHQGGFLVWRDQEPMELLLSLGFLFFAAANFIRLRICLARASSGREPMRNE
jgi:hypothetical protein